ncbi:MAG: hypothetical protein PHX21_00505 [bacterium]|nr:hypothetical protein [bacterium]
MKKYNDFWISFVSAFHPQKRCTGRRIIFGISILVISWNNIYSYSLFSGANIGEPNTDIRLVKINVPKEWCFEIAFSGELVRSSYLKADSLNVSNFDFTVPYLEWTLPLPKGFGVAIGVNEIFNINYDILSSTEKIEGSSDSVFHNIKSRGSLSSINLIGDKNFGNFATVGMGVALLFGSVDEQWAATHTRGTATDTTFYDTISSTFSGTGLIGNIGIRIGKAELGVSYLGKSTLNSDNELPVRVRTSLSYNIISDFKIGFGTEDWLFADPGIPLSRLAITGEFGKKTKYKAGVYKKDWYYGNIKEKGGMLGVNLPFKSMLQLGLTGEYGTRDDGTLCEKTYRVYLTIQGKEAF